MKTQPKEEDEFRHRHRNDEKYTLNKPYFAVPAHTVQARQHITYHT